MINKFLEYIKVEKRYSNHTVKGYHQDLNNFLIFLKKSEGTENLIDVDKKIIRNFMVSLTEKGLSKRSINRILSSLRSFYHFLLKLGIIEVSPLEEIKSLKFNPEKQIPISEDEMNGLQEIYTSQNVCIFEMLIVEILYQTGMRRAELCNMEMKKLDKKNVASVNGQIKIFGKKNKERIIPISRDLSKMMEAYLQERKTLPEFEQYFFVGKRGKKLNEGVVYTIVKKYLTLINTSKEKRSPHILRHSFATHILNNGAEISKVRTLLGHSSLSSTQVYTDANIEQLKNIFKNTHPRAQKED